MDWADMLHGSLTHRCDVTPLQIDLPPLESTRMQRTAVRAALGAYTRVQMRPILSSLGRVSRMSSSSSSLPVSSSVGAPLVPREQTIPAPPTQRQAPTGVKATKQTNKEGGGAWHQVCVDCSSDKCLRWCVCLFLLFS